MLRLRPSNTTPPDKFQYKFPNGYVIYGVTRDEWLAKINKYADDNDLPQPTVEEAEHQLCKRLSGEWCVGGDDASFVNPRFTLDDFLRGTKVLSSFVLDGAKIVAPEVAEERARICSQCVVNMSVPGCSACSGMANAVAAAKGAQSTKYDHLLRACGICHCANEAQVWLPAEYLAKGVTPHMLEQYKQIDICWKRDELLALLD